MKLKQSIFAAITVTLLGSSSSLADEKLTVGLPSGHGFFGLHLYVAEEKGFLDDLSFEYQIFKGGSEVLKQVANGLVDIGFAQPTEIMIQNSAKGVSLPIKYWYMLETHSANQIAVLRDSEIQSLADLKGKAIGISSPTASNVVQFRAVLEQAGIDPENDIIWRAVGLGPAHIQALITGDIDVSATNNMRHAAFQFAGADLRIIPTEVTENFFGNGLFSNISMLESAEGVKQLETVASGIAKATQFCVENAEECVDIMYKRFPELQSGELDDDANKALGMSQVNARNTTTQLRPEQNGIYGYFPDLFWNASVDFLAKAENLSTKPDVSAFYTNDIVERVAQ